MRISMWIALLGLAACDLPGDFPGQDVDGRRPGSPTAAPASDRQGDTLGGADSFPAKTSAPTADADPGPAGGAVVVRMDPTAKDSPPAEHLVAVVNGTEKSPNVRGVIHFRKVANGVAITSEVKGLPVGAHAYHVHVFGDCSAPDGESAGPHLDFAALPGGTAPVAPGAAVDPRSPNLSGPTGAAPAGAEPAGAHAGHITGNLGDLTVAANGTATAQEVIVGLDAASVGQLNGRSVVIHVSPNDPSQPPDGAAGARLACGVIGVARGDGALPASL